MAGKEQEQQAFVNPIIFSSPLHLTIQFFLFLKKCVQGFTAEDLLLYPSIFPEKTP